MATLITILDALYNELVTVADTDIGLSNPGDHVGMLNRSVDIETPYLGIEWDRTAVRRGLGGRGTVTAINEDNNGDIDSVERARFYDLTIDIGVLIDGDHPREGEQYLLDVENHLSQFVGNACDFNSDAERFLDQGTTPSNLGAGADFGIRTTYEIRYCKKTTESVPAAETVDWNVDVDGIDAYPENYG